MIAEQVVPALVAVMLRLLLGGGSLGYRRTCASRCQPPPGDTRRS